MRTPLGAAGFSLVELMVALALGLIILAAMLDAFNSNSATGTTNARFTEVQTNSRYAIDYMRRELRHAGYLGVQGVGNTLSPCGTSGSSFTTLQSCNITWVGSSKTTSYGGCGANILTKIDWPIWGTDDANSLSCTNMSYSTGDVLVLRRTGAQKLSGAAVNNTLYVRTGLTQALVYIGSDQGLAGTTACPSPQVCTREDYPLEADIYYIAPCTNAPGTTCESPAVPALYRLTLGVDATAAMTPQLIATGIENMQIQYGVAASDFGSINSLLQRGVARDHRLAQRGRGKDLAACAQHRRRVQRFQEHNGLHAGQPDDQPGRPIRR